LRSFPAGSCLGPVARFEVATLRASDFLQLPPGGIEGITQRHVCILVMRAVDHDFPAWHAHIQADLEMTALLMVLAQLLDRDAAAGDARMEFLELCGLFAYARLEGVGLREIPDGDLKELALNNPFGCDGRKRPPEPGL
jgi:hypothetical protein